MTSGSLTGYPRYYASATSRLPRPGLRDEAKQHGTTLYARLGETGCTRLHRALAQVKPPGQRQAARVEREIDDQRQLRSAGHGDRLAEAARDQIAAASPNGADEPKRCAALNAGGL